MYFCRDCDQVLGQDEITIEYVDEKPKSDYFIICNYCGQDNVHSLPDDAPDPF